MDTKRIIDFSLKFAKNIGIGVLLMLSAICVLLLLGYVSNTTIDPSIFLIATMAGWCTICFKLWFDYINGKPKTEKIVSAIIYLFILTGLGLIVILFVVSMVSTQPILKEYFVKAAFSWYFSAIISILYEKLKP